MLLQREGLADEDVHVVLADITTQGLLRGYRTLAGVVDRRSGCADAVGAIFGLGHYAPRGRRPWLSRSRGAVPARVDLAFERIIDEQRSVFYRDRHEVRDRFDGRLALRSIPAAAVAAWSAWGAGEVERGLHDVLGAEAYRAADPNDAERFLMDALAARAAGMGDDQMNELLRQTSLLVMDEQWAAHLGRVRFVQRHGNVTDESLRPAAVLERLFAWCRLVTVEHTLGYALNVEP
ncbi:hypothetical protein Ais01nite_03220 [Asanoa ishikariensis]|uniref:hypothetical protein n=1 Tax=Asanoa ishikariensis TaxID=137265 RepID=UPI001A60F315|nr:hypothetical protein [Asanoa ishikariensis]GIF62287.1 hypothetical protein Ais01nite_03220 [Asanoa ishikariensis]